MNVNDAFPSKYLKASDLGTAAPVVTISHVEMEKIGRENDRKPVVFFEGKEKGLVLNKTNSRRITELLGTSETDEWVGGKVRIFATETEFGGETVECIRVKAAGPTNGSRRLPDPVQEDEQQAKRMMKKHAAPAPVALDDDDSEIPF